MKKLLLLFVVVLVAFSTPHKTNKSFVYGVYKVGDKRTASGKEHMGVRDGMIIEVIDPEEWPQGEPVISNFMQKAFCIIKHNRSWKQDLRDAATDSGNSNNPQSYKVKRKKIDFNEIGNTIGDTALDWKLRCDSLVMIDGTNFDKKILKNTAVIDRPLNYICYDYNAITSGSATVGSGGTYATFAIALADLGNLTGDVTFTQITDATETATAGISEDLGGYTLTITSSTDHQGSYNNGLLLTMQHNVHMFLLGQEGNGVVDLCCLKTIRTVAPNSSSRAFVLAANISAGVQTIRIYNNIHNGDQGGHMFSSTDDTPTIYMYDNISLAGYSGVSVDLNDGNANSVYENNSFYNHTVAGIKANDGAGAFGVYRNNICIDNFADFSGISAGATGVNNISGDATADDGGWSTGSNNLTGLSASSQWVSVVVSDGDSYLKPVANSSAALSGTTPSYATTLINGVVWTSEIGAKSKVVSSSNKNFSKYSNPTYKNAIYKNDDYKKFIYNK